MAEVAQRIAQLDEVLRQVHYRYENRDRLRNDVANLLKTTPTLQPSQQQFEGQGRKVILFYLCGVLPIEYQRTRYNIPVTIYFDPPYPRGPPRCFVTPSQGMALKPSHPHVDTGGMVYIPYLNTWNERNSSLIELVRLLSSVFSTAPPVYSTGQAAAAKPVVQATPVQAPTQPATGFMDGVGQALSGLFGASVVQATPVQAAEQPRPSQPPVQAQAIPTVVAQPVVRPTLVPQSPRSKAASQATQGLQERWRFVLEPLVTDVNERLETKNNLQIAAAKIGDDVSNVRAAAEKASKDAADLQRAEAGLREFVKKSAGRDVDPDSLRDEVDPDSRQVLTCLAEELALDELLAALDELLGAKKVTLDDFLREVRDVSRRQFLCRVQRKKAAAAVAALS